MENKLTEQDIFVGATVIRADGLKGKIYDFTTIYDDKVKNAAAFIVQYENGQFSLFVDMEKEPTYSPTIRTWEITLKDGTVAQAIHENPSDFYLIGHCILGNRIEVAEIDEQIASLTAEKNRIDTHIDQLRKQRFRLNNQMDGRTVAERKAEEQTRTKKDDTNERMRLQQIRSEKQRLQAEASKIFKSLDEKKKKDGDDE